MKAASNIPESNALPAHSAKVTRSMVVRMNEVATPERKKQMGGVVNDYEADGPKSRVMLLRHRARTECVLDVYRLQGKIDIEEFEAGMRFRIAYLCKAEGIKTRDSMDGITVSGDYITELERMTWAEGTLKEAYGELSHFQALIITHVCGTDQIAGSTARLQTLKRGLSVLAKLWGLL
jgi:hypothetical protein